MRLIRLQPARSPMRSGPRRARHRAARSLVTAAAALAVAVISVGPLAAPPAVGAVPAASQSNPVVLWTAVNSSSGPPPLAYASAAYDADTSTIVLFGGAESDGTLSGRTWIWNGSAWSQAPARSSPPARELASMAFDPTLHELILFGGQGSGGALLNDTWAWNGLSWSIITTSGPSPSPREAASLAYESKGGLLLFGGTGSSGSGAAATATTLPGAPTTQPAGGSLVPLRDTWLWTQDGWAQSSAPGPPPRSGAAMAYDGQHGTTVLFGGESTPASAAVAKPLADTWTWNGSAWAAARPPAQPPARFGAVADGDPAVGGPMLLGGEGTGGDMNDVYVWKGSTWVRAWVEGAPLPREGGAGAYDAATQELVVFGGKGGGGVTLGDTGLVKVVPTHNLPTAVPTTPGTTVARGGPTTGPTGRSTTTTRPKPTSPTTRPPAAVTTTLDITLEPISSVMIETPGGGVRRGGAVRVSGAGFAPGSTVTLTFHSAPARLGTTRTDGNGRFDTTISVPRDASPGEHHIVAAGISANGAAANPAAGLNVVVPSARTSTDTKLVLVGLAILMPAATYLAMAAAGVWRRWRQGAA